MAEPAGVSPCVAYTHRSRQSSQVCARRDETQSALAAGPAERWNREWWAARLRRRSRRAAQGSLQSLPLPLRPSPLQMRRVEGCCALCTCRGESLICSLMLVGCRRRGRA